MRREQAKRTRRTSIRYALSNRRAVPEIESSASTREDEYGGDGGDDDDDDVDKLARETSTSTPSMYGISSELGQQEPIWGMLLWKGKEPDSPR